MNTSLVGAAPGGDQQGVHGAQEAGQAGRERLQVAPDAHDEPVGEGDQLVDDDRPVLPQLPIELRRPLGPKLSGPLLRREPQGDLAGVDVEEDLVFGEQAEYE